MSSVVRKIRSNVPGKSKKRRGISFSQFCGNSASSDSWRASLDWNMSDKGENMQTFLMSWIFPEGFITVKGCFSICQGLSPKCVREIRGSVREFNFLNSAATLPIHPLGAKVAVGLTKEPRADKEPGLGKKKKKKMWVFWEGNGRSTEAGLGEGSRGRGAARGICRR